MWIYKYMDMQIFYVVQKYVICVFLNVELYTLDKSVRILPYLLFTLKKKDLIQSTLNHI